MTVIELAERVKAMREAQTGYFKTRDRVLLARSKSLERSIDATVDKILNGASIKAKPLPGQAKLFD